MADEYIVVVTRLLAALAAGAMIGLERSYNGRPAGFRTHSLVCMSSSLLMLLTVYQWQLLANVPQDTLRVDPTRMAQGIMTGIGFLGAGVIMKENYAIRGLTTAASIWITASIGILIGVGFYFAGILATVLALGVLSGFRRLERMLPTLKVGRLSVRTLRNGELNEEEILVMLAAHGITTSDRSYYLEDSGKFVRYEMQVSSRNPVNFRKLAETLAKTEKICEFSVIPKNS